MPRYHEIGPDGQPVMPVQTTIHSASETDSPQTGVIHSASFTPDYQASTGHYEDTEGPLHTAYATRGAMRTEEEDFEDRRTSWKDWKVPEKKLEPRQHEPIPRGPEFGLEPMTTVVPSLPSAGDQQQGQ